MVFLACSCAFPCLPLCLSLPAFAPFLACICAFPCLPLCLFLPAFVLCAIAFRKCASTSLVYVRFPKKRMELGWIFFLVHYSQFYPNTLLLLVHGFSPYDGNSIVRVLEIWIINLNDFSLFMGTIILMPIILMGAYHCNRQ